MIFLIPLFIIIAVIFGVDYYYYADEDAKIERKIEPSKIEQKRQENAKKYFNAMIIDELDKN